MAIRVRNESGLQIDEVINYEIDEPKTINDLKAGVKDWDKLTERVKEAHLADFNEIIAGQGDGDTREEDLELLLQLRSYISTLNGYLEKARNARKATAISVLKKLKASDYTKEKLDPIQEASGFISYHQLLGQIATHVDGKTRPAAAADQKARDWTAVDGIEPALVAKVAEIAKLK